MYPILLHLWGPFAIHSYGLAIVIGVLLFVRYTFNHPVRKTLMDSELFHKILARSVLIGVAGGKIAYVLGERLESLSWSEVCFWEGGLSVTGCIIALSIYALWICWYYKLPLGRFCDLMALNVPLVQAAGRIGCFLAGCCYGLPTNVLWGITYINPACYAPLSIKLHPVQLYSALFMILWWVLLRYYEKSLSKRPGSLAALYLFGAGLERFVLDFMRGDRIMVAGQAFLSVYQLVALCLVIVSMVLLSINSVKTVR
jgi:phosphatidylglycerol:prolipoprotein diacylglycerol transferase